jgi:hypothetical protein
MKKKSFIFIMSLIFLFSFGIDNLHADTTSNYRTALVVGNNQYKFSPLKNPLNDAKDMAYTLSECNFQVIECINCNASQLRSSIRSFEDTLREKGGCGVFYYAGHGVQVKGENYIIPVDVDVLREYEVKDNCVSVSSLLGALEFAGNSLNIVILDACRNNPFESSFRSSSKGLATVDAPVGTLIAYSTGPGSIANDGGGVNSIYTSTLLKYLTVEGLPVEEIFKKTRKDIMEITNKEQIPWESTSLTGSFVFRESSIKKDDPKPDIKQQIALVDQKTEIEVISAKKKKENDIQFYKIETDSSFVKIENRFVKIDDKIVYDKFLKRKWLIVRQEIYDWDEANAVLDHNIYKGFRIPTKDELATLIMKKESLDQWGMINTNFFPYNSRTKKYWTINSSGILDNSYWYLDFDSGELSKMSGSNYCSVLAIGD